MSSLVSRVARRLFWSLGGLAIIAWGLSQPASGSFASNAQDGVLFFLSAAMFAATLPRLVRFYTAPVVSSSELLAFAMSAVSIGFVVSTMSSVHIRAAGHLAPSYDGPSRVIFRELQAVFVGTVLVTAGSYEPDVFRSAAMMRWRRLGLVVASALLVLALLANGDRAVQWLWTRQDRHDTAPGAPDTDGTP